ncbi:hypothetical protein OEA41_006380 [Lepraria neglecta]|uniref:Uncharacterized protein n=1 Tax=Lepraria neglecta TaxID=209136 RepID=A0AAE0DKJ6_9LECA|nr:hypothetical protein OEA41_006380 [Lepraria neglecta]
MSIGEASQPKEPSKPSILEQVDALERKRANTRVMKEAEEELGKFLSYPDNQDDSGAGADDEAQKGKRESALEAQDMRDLEKECEKLDCLALRKSAIRVQEVEQQRKDRQKLDCHADAKKCQCILKAVGSRERIPSEDEGEGIRCIRPVGSVLWRFCAIPQHTRQARCRVQAQAASSRAKFPIHLARNHMENPRQ